MTTANTSDSTPTAPEPRMRLDQAAPTGFRAVAALDRSIGDAGLDPTLVLLVQTRASQINGCGFCIDMHIKDALRSGEPVHRYYGLDAWREAPYYTSAERAALALTEAMTLLAPGGVPDPVWRDAVEQFDEQQLGGLIMTVVSINAWNRIAITTRSPTPGSYKATD